MQEILGTDPFLLGAAAGAAGLLAYGVHRLWKSDGYAATPIKERWARKILAPADKFGHKLGKRLHYEERPKGYVHRAYRSTVDIDIDPKNELNEEELEEMEETQENSSLVQYDSVVYSASKGGALPKRKIQKYLYKLGSMGFLRTDNGINRFAEYYDLPTYKVEIRGDIIRIKDSADLVQVRGNYYRDNNQQAMEKIRQLTFSDMFEDNMELISNLGEQTHHLNIETSREGYLMNEKFSNIKEYKKLEQRKEKEEAMES